MIGSELGSEESSVGWLRSPPDAASLLSPVVVGEPGRGLFSGASLPSLVSAVSSVHRFRSMTPGTREKGEIRLRASAKNGTGRSWMRIVSNSTYIYGENALVTKNFV